MARRDSLCCRSYTSLELALSCRKGCAHFRRALPRDEGACGVQVNVRALASAAVPLILEPERVMARRDAAKIDGRVGEVVPAEALASATAAATAAKLLSESPYWALLSVCISPKQQTNSKLLRDRLHRRFVSI